MRLGAGRLAGLAGRDRRPGMRRFHGSRGSGGISVGTDRTHARDDAPRPRPSVDQSGDPFRAPFERGRAGGHRLLDRLGPLDHRDGDGIERRSASIPPGRRRRRRRCTDAGCGGAPGDAEGGLAERGLGVDPALAGDDEVGAGELAVEVGRRPSRGRSPGTSPNGANRSVRRAARTRCRRPRRRPACRARDVPSRAPAHPHSWPGAVELGDDVRGRALLRPVHCGGAAIRPEERIGHVAGDLQARPRPAAGRARRGRPVPALFRGRRSAPRAPGGSRIRRRSSRCRRSPA